MNPNAASRMRVHIVAAAALTGLSIAVGVQRKQSDVLRPEGLNQDIDRTTRIAPDGSRINGSWVAANFNDQEMVDIAQSIHRVLSGDRRLPPIARHLLRQRCHELETSLEARVEGHNQTDFRSETVLCHELASLQRSLSSGMSDRRPTHIPVTDRDSATLLRLIESVIYPLCEWDKKTLEDLVRDSEKNLGKLRP